MKAARILGIGMGFMGLLLLCADTAGTGIAQAATTIKGVSAGSLVGWWTMDEGTSTIAHDFSGNLNNATFTGTPVWSAGKRGKSLYFNGSNTSITTPDSNSLDITTDITLSAWFKEDVGSGSNRWLIDKGNVNSSYAMFLEGGLKMRLIKPGMQDCTVTEPTEGVWHHAVSTYDGTNMRVYVDGVLANTCAATGSISTTAVGVRIGSFESNGYAFKGFIDDARVYNRVLTPGEVTALYRSGETVRKNVSGDGLVGWWTMDEGTSTIAHDFSGNNYTGALSNFALTGATSNWSTSGKRDGSLDFDGVNDQIYGSIPASTFAGDFTIAAWFNHRALSQWAGIFSNSVGTNEAALMTMRDSTTQMGIMRVGVLDSGVFVELGADHYGKWIYGVITRQGSNLAVHAYKDGRLISSTGTLSWTLNTDNEFYIGRHYSGGSHMFNGKIDDVRVYNRALSLSEIDTLYRQGAVAINSSQNTKLTSGLIGLWSFNGADMTWTSASTGIARDQSGNNNHGALTNMSQATTPDAGKVGQALVLDGVNDYIEIPDSPSLRLSGDATISMWVKPGSTQKTYADIISKHSCGGYVIEQNAASTNQFVFAWDPGSCSYTGGAVSTTLTANIWQNFTVVKSGTTVTHYVNGVQTATGSGSSAAIAVSAVNLKISNFGSGSNREFNGSVDEVRVYNRSLSLAEVKQLYLMGK